MSHSHSSRFSNLGSGNTDIAAAIERCWTYSMAITGKTLLGSARDRSNPSGPQNAFVLAMC